MDSLEETKEWEAAWKPQGEGLLQECLKTKGNTEAVSAVAVERFIGMESIFGMLILYGIAALMPEIRAWLKLPAMTVVLFRQKLEKRLLDYAKEKELDYEKAEKAAEQIVKKIDISKIKRFLGENSE